MLDQFKVPYAVSEDEPHGGRPISIKVANLMRNECSSGIFVFAADEEFTQVKTSCLSLGPLRSSDNRIVIFKEEGVTFPSDFSDLGYITFKWEQLAERMADLFQESIEHDILEVRAKNYGESVFLACRNCNRRNYSVVNQSAAISDVANGFGIDLSSSCV